MKSAVCPYEHATHSPAANALTNTPHNSCRGVRAINPVFKPGCDRSLLF
ncbi:hypothetical protein [Rivularia sp. UHCC 0363]|nr:hypothetical protein [Rivularia sp. UHCC 0363]MEA5598365.1 hypothetical protein [Rivularia sp. UHCC 0363]